jgi:catechol 2,3-dioxygenase-like lactoylglutathione lyase family enzyme
MSNDETPAATPAQDIRLHHAIPIFRVANLATSLDYYTRILGFEIPWQLPYYASVKRGTCSLMLCEGGQGNPGTWIWAPVSDADALYEEWLAAGANILQGAKSRSSTPTTTASASPPT